MIQVVHCKKVKNHEYIGRGTPLGNPFVWDNTTPKGSTLPKYRVWLRQRIVERDAAVIAEINRLYKLSCMGDLNLGCWCAPTPCHGDIIKEVLDNMHKRAKQKG